jgi:aryl-alcohol dehydrogenase-like predicted oxidoreductase
MVQLKDNIAAFDMPLSADALKGIATVMRQYPAPF